MFEGDLYDVLYLIQNAQNRTELMCFTNITENFLILTRPKTYSILEKHSSFFSADKSHLRVAFGQRVDITVYTLLNFIHFVFMGDSTFIKSIRSFSNFPHECLINVFNLICFSFSFLKSWARDINLLSTRVLSCD